MKRKDKKKLDLMAKKILSFRVKSEILKINKRNIKKS